VYRRDIADTDDDDQGTVPPGTYRDSGGVDEPSGFSGNGYFSADYRIYTG